MIISLAQMLNRSHENKPIVCYGRFCESIASERAAVNDREALHSHGEIRQVRKTNSVSAARMKHLTSVTPQNTLEYAVYSMGAML